MNFYNFTFLITFLINYTVWSHVFIQYRHHPISKSYLIFAANLGLFMIMEFLSLSFFDPILVDKFHHIEVIFWVSIGSTFLLFVQSLTQFRHLKWLIPSFFLLTWIGIVFAAFTPWVISGVTQKAFGFQANPGPLYFPWLIIFVILPVLYGLLLLVRKSKLTRKGEIKVQCKLIILGTLLSLILGVTTDVVLPHILHFYTYFPLGSGAAFIQSIMIYIAIRQFNLLSVSISDSANYLFHHVSDGVFLMDTRGCIRYVNRAACGLLNKSNIELFGKHIYRFFDKKNYDFTERVYNREISARETRLSLIAKQSTVQNGEKNLGHILIIRNA